MNWTCAKRNEVSVSRRSERVGHLIRTILAEAIRDHLADPRIPLITSLTRVEVSEDLEVAHIHVSALGRDVERKLCLGALQGAAGRLRRLLAPELRLRKVPTLVFRLDDSISRGYETVTAIDQAMRELGEIPEWERVDQAPANPDCGAGDEPEIHDLPGAAAEEPRPGLPQTRPEREEDA